MHPTSLVTLDIGGTKVNFGRFRNGIIEHNQEVPFCAHGSSAQIRQFLIDGIAAMIATDTTAICIGVPCIVDVEHGIVFDAVNIPAWQKYPLKDELSEHFDLPVYINNDVNCFVAGEANFGDVARFEKNVVGICLGTGFGTGFYLNDQLYAGHNCCAGELGGIPYLNGTLDDYCSGSFFTKMHHVNGAELAERARAGDVAAQAIFHEFAQHLAKGISYLMFTVDPKVIVVGGSVAKSFDLYIDSLWQSLDSFPYKKVRTNLNIVKSELKNAALLGAAALYIGSC
ncbi:ROK family protein [Thalassotalea sp. 1_MG-2023]|uniref:ROK family protein n=1 Tax=Thalassotalea sp. 1_MG-2023 TaxID=3062680 RepID=UPI0026E164B1|nr:ROK family protein [Thalassotalea sp. 1_MG-2023]MDO6425541.1 ROK family protein [Thalassotalea sp. 1_MG-2023]